MSSESAPAARGSGFAYALAAYAAWGLFPIYWKQLGHVPALTVISHRVVWSFLFVAGLLTVGRRWREVKAALGSRRTLGALLVSTALISSNWFLFIWAVNTGHVTQASLGYYINPLLNVVLARVILGERLRRPQLVAVVLAATGVVSLAVSRGELPWVSLLLAATFGVYGLVRKMAPVEPLTGLAVETGLAAPVALVLVALAPAVPGATGGFGASMRDTLLLVGSGVATALPLLWFALGAKRLRYGTLGIIQYVAPTLQLALAVLVYGEPFTRPYAVAFACIWTAVLLYALDALWWSRPRPLPVHAARQGA
ncbi:EamA family transporter RarD [Pyxidicoccus fallax]|uniref:EamA family transporter RarD n=1 Tax=Pyxidicoccus fallax TaxID=394095 RepID=A0A848LKX2_9BACT|nr:EamA family transporter RarD [Pyxidicoccus fallax]NMO18425.1 EamA family transporter RarD [Pyxidicoccus fallax]NPC78905.1 EamA family transporter RarD [Pyxidicoccus fallax]